MNVRIYPAIARPNAVTFKIYDFSFNSILVSKMTNGAQVAIAVMQTSNWLVQPMLNMD